MTTFQILTINWGHIFNAVVLLLSFSGFVISYNKYMKRTVDQNDLDKLEKKMDNENRELSSRIDKVEQRLKDDVADIKQMNRDILNHILNCTKR